MGYLSSRFDFISWKEGLDFGLITQKLGRFLSVDPLADDDQEEWSPYAAMGNNPAMMVDPLGLKGENTETPLTRDVVAEIMSTGGSTTNAPNGSNLDKFVQDANEAAAERTEENRQMEVNETYEKAMGMYPEANAGTPATNDMISDEEINIVLANSTEVSEESPEDPGDGKKKGDNNNDQNGDSSKGRSAPSYTPAPKELPGFPGTGKGKRHSESGRKRWIDENGDILEWDSQHGEVEKYDKSGRTHKGAFDPKTGKQISPAVPGRRTAKIVGYDPTTGLRAYNAYQNIVNSIRDWLNAPSAPCNCE